VAMANEIAVSARLPFAYTAQGIPLRNTEW
jgi:hypothetical protein